MKLNLKIFNTLITLLTITAVVLPLSAQQYVVKNYTVEDGLPIRITRAMVQDRNGYMWFAANGGILKYDGFSWQTLLKDTDQRSNYFNYIELDSKG